MNVRSALGLNSASTMSRVNLVSAVRVTDRATYGSRLVSLYASFWKCAISHFAVVAVRLRSSSIHRSVLYMPVARATAHAAHSHHSFMPITLGGQS